MRRGGSHLHPRPFQEYERLAANLDGARTPLLEKMRAFSPAGSKVGLVEAAETHAQQLAQLALNLSRCVAAGCPGDATGPSWGTAYLGGLLEEAAVVCTRSLEGSRPKPAARDEKAAHGGRAAGQGLGTGGPEEAGRLV